MLIWVVGAAAIALLIIADVLFMGSRKPHPRQALRYRKRRRGKGTIPDYAKLPFSPQMKNHQVYDGFEELFEALSGEGHKGLFVIAEDDVKPVFYQEVDT